MVLTIVMTGCGSTAPASNAAAAKMTTKAQSGSHSSCRSGSGLGSGSDSAHRFRLLGEIRWDVETRYGGVPVGGLSSIDWDAERGEYLLVSDDRAEHGPARYYTAQLRYDGHGLHDAWLTGMHELKGEGQRSFGNTRNAASDMPVPDAEAMRVNPHTRTLLWTSEGDVARGFGPGLYEAERGGPWLRAWPLPPLLQRPQDPREAATTGPRGGFTLEGMGFSEDGQTLWLAMEGALKQDGPMPSPGDAGAPVRITALDAQTQAPIRQIAYQPDALPGTIWLLRHRAVNGVSDILADGPDHLLVLERSFSVDFGWGARLYRIRIQGDAAQMGTDTLNLPRLVPGQFRVAAKELLLDFAQLGLRSIDNLEGITWGPPLISGERVLVLASDNNFNPAEVTQFVALAEVSGCFAE